MRRIKITYNDQIYVLHLPKMKEALNCVFHAQTIYLRFDSLCQLIDSCNDHLAQLTHLDEKITSLRDRALKMAMAIVNTDDIREFNEKRKKRGKYSRLDSDYMPWRTPFDREKTLDSEVPADYLRRSWQIHSKNVGPHKLLFMNYLNRIVDDADKVRYLTKAEREKCRIFASKSKLMRFRFSNTTPYASLYLENFDTKYYAAHAHEGSAIFVVTAKGDMFAGSSEACKFYHSSMVAGSAVMYAGSMKVTFGQLKEIDNRSGHYMPTRQHVMQLLDFFNECGVLNKHVDVMCLSLPNFAKVKIDYPIRKTKPVDMSHRLKITHTS